MSELALPQSHLHVIARDPTEMERANKQLVGWLSEKIAREFQELKDANENYQIARKAKWRSEPWKRRASRHKARIIFYQKLRSALKAGYYIVPPLPVDIFAVRTDRQKPTGYVVRSHQFGNDRQLAQKSRRLPEGKGRYVAAEPEVWLDDLGHEDKDGKWIERWRHYAKEFQNVDFPFRMARPETLTATAEAMGKKLFDQIGVLPRYRRRGDPIVMGQVCPPEAHKEPVTFFIAWWLHTEDW